MFEKLNRLRTEHERAKARYEEAKAKLDDVTEKLKAEEATSILDIVGRLEFTPEQLAEFLGIGDSTKTGAPKSKKKDSKAKDKGDVAAEKDAEVPEEKTGIMEDIINENY